MLKYKIQYLTLLLFLFFIFFAFPAYAAGKADSLIGNTVIAMVLGVAVIAFLIKKFLG